jgi:hypothetical protein
MPASLIMEFVPTNSRFASGRVGPVKSATARAQARGSLSAHPTTAEWTRHKERIHDLYIKQDKILKDVAQVMWDEHKFFAT